MKACQNKHPIGCENELASKCIFMPTFISGQF